MKKLLVVFSDLSYATYLADYAIQMVKEDGGFIHAALINPLIFSTTNYPFPSDIALAQNEVIREELSTSEAKLSEANVKQFKHSCEAAGVNYKISSGLDVTVEEIIDHSAFADLVLCEAKNRIQEIYIRELLADTHCPVMLVRENPETPVRAILCYDESFSSILAIKMFSYLFPEWKQLPGHIVSINPKGDNGGLKFDEYLSEWLPLHFPTIEHLTLEGNLQRELVSLIRQGQQPTVVVMGAYGRNAISRMFHRSLANVVIEETDASVFIMHE